MDLITLALAKKQIGQGIPAAVSDYLDEHLTNPTDPPIDTSLTIAGAAADSKETGDKITQLKEELNNVNNAVFAYAERTATAVSEGWRLNANDGLCSQNSSYKLLKFAVTSGDVIKVVSDDRFQFNTVASVPASGTSNRVGVTYGTGEFVLEVPETATYLIVSTFVSNSSAKASIQFDNVKSMMDELGTPIPPTKFEGSNNIGDLIKYQSAKIIENKYVWGVNGQKVSVENNSNYTYVVVSVVPNKTYHFPTVSWWAVTDSDDNVVLGCGGNGTSTSQVSTVGYSNAAKLYVSILKTTNRVYVIDNNAGNTSFEWTIDGLATNPNNNVFSIPDFKFITGKEWSLYFDGAWLRKAEYARTSYGYQQYDDHFSLRSTSAGYVNNGIRLCDNNFNNIGTYIVHITYVAPNYRNLTALFIGDSTINNGKLTEKVLEVFANNNVTCTLLGTTGDGNNKREGRSGWTSSDYCGLTTRGKDATQNPFYNLSTEQFDFSYYMAQQGYSEPDFVFIQLGINDMFSVSFDDFKTGYAIYKANMLAIINSIHNYSANIKIVVNLITMPNGNTSAFNTLYGCNYYNWERRYIDIMANHKLIEDLPSYVIRNPHNLILDPMTNISDDVHPTADGYAILGEFDANVMFAN